MERSGYIMWTFLPKSVIQKIFQFLHFPNICREVDFSFPLPMLPKQPLNIYSYIMSKGYCCDSEKYQAHTVCFIYFFSSF